ncbi:CoA pyrophosphatase [Novosphingobium sp. SG707]|uniref:CoA pyrophosphatase n=1 Tax=Novosphingobium sp. SG707 TaxID=2586996 RepID=UPI00144514AF|nr:CoA pyrophosphatase [Novosphingobium sp. SG707]NKJ02113.1 8-oxo-dGTP pyrophosphatase MutT (NUDIX family) [Novosphingobium sp. SG707]
MSNLRYKLERLYHTGMAGPVPALFPDPRTAGIEEFKPAAVLIAVTERAAPGVLMIHRPGTMRAHAGQVALPGGRLDPGETDIDAAVREAQEELGIDPRHVDVIGPLDVFLTGSGYAVTPVLALIPPDLPLVPNPDEVAEWFEAPFGFVMDPANHQRRAIEWEGKTRHLVEIPWNGHRIWGITGAILANLSKRLNWPND